METSDKIIIEELRRIINKSPRSSSLREKSGRKAGGQPGHEGRTLDMIETPDKIIEHGACFCHQNVVEASTVIAAY